ncbi:MAG: hypothetical protein C4576_26585 [Desulfobacteraceae bacterium]|nr:MAG: hypothetical protein C4576_26585 [Desulfobacteraceae bacterium]
MDTEITAPEKFQGVDVSPEERSTESLRFKAGQVASRVSEELREETAKRARGFLNSKKEDLAGELHKTAEVFRESSNRFQEREQGTAARYVEQVAAQADRFSRYLNEKDLDQLASEIEVVARRSPMLFLVSAFAGGFIMSRFLRSPGASSRTSATEYGATYGTTH